MPRGARRSPLAGAEPLPPRRKWRAILLATLLLAPAFWAVLVGLILMTADDPTEVPPAGPFIAFGLAVIPFVFVVLAFLSEHPRAPGAVVKAMILSLFVGVPLSALAADAVTGLVAALGSGGIVALRADPLHSWRARALAVVVASTYIFFMVRVAPEVALVIAPALPFSALGVADHLAERRGDVWPARRGRTERDRPR